MSYSVCVSVTCVMLKCIIIMLYNYVLIYYLGIRVKNLNFGLKNIHFVLLLCITDVYYYDAFFVYCVLLLSIITVKICLR